MQIIIEFASYSITLKPCLSPLQNALVESPNLSNVQLVQGLPLLLSCNRQRELQRQHPCFEGDVMQRSMAFQKPLQGVFGRRERKIEGEGHISPKWRIIERMEGFFLSYCLV